MNLDKTKIFRVNIHVSLESMNVNGWKKALLLEIPRKTEVPQGSVVQWNIVGLEGILNEPSTLLEEGLIFTIYFSDKSPFHWKRQFIQLHNRRCGLYLTNGIIRLAEEVADESGDYKYGIKVTDGKSDETTLYDEDPYLIVY